jgi:hypothetical protein
MASGCTFTKASTTSFISPWSPVAALPSQVQQLLKEFPPLLRPSAAPPKPSTASYITSTQVAPSPCLRALGSWTRRNTASPKRNFSPWRRQVLFSAQTRLGHPRCTWSPRRMGRGTPAATIATSTLSQSPTGTPSPICSTSMTAWPGALFFGKSVLAKLTIRSPLPRRHPKNGDSNAFRPMGILVHGFRSQKAQHRPYSGSKTIS